MNVNVLSTIPEDWNSWILDRGTESGYLQTAYWSHVSGYVNQSKSYIVDVTDDDGIRLAGLLILHKRVHRPSNICERLAQWFSGENQGILQAIDGPVFHEGFCARSLKALLGGVNSLAKKLGVRVVQIGQLPVMAPWSISAEAAELFQAYEFEKRIWATSLIKLPMLEGEQLWQGIKANARKGIKRCEREGVSITMCLTREEYLEKFHLPFFSRRLGDQSSIPSDWWDIDANGGQNYKFFYASAADGSVLGVLGTYAFAGLATEVMSERMSEAGNTPVQDLLHWHAYKYHYANGDLYFDLAGFNPEASSGKELGIKRFKEKWQGEPRELIYFDRRQPRPGFRLLQKMRKGLSSLWR